MPRIELIPNKPQDEATPTIDVCVACAEEYQFEEGEAFPKLAQFLANLGDLSLPSCRIGSTDVEHPPYDDLPGAYECVVCGERLSQTLDA